MSVKAKFYVSNVQSTTGSESSTVTLGAVCRGVENALWAQYTPAGQITMSIRNDVATVQFEPGCEYEVTFTKVPKPERGDGHPSRPTPNKQGYLVCETCGLSLNVPGTPGEPSDDAHDVHEEHYGAR